MFLNTDINYKTTKSKFRIAIADDHTILAQSLSSLINSETDLEVSIIANNGKDLLSKIYNNLTDLVLLDIEMPVMNGEETVEVLKRSYPNLKIIVLSMYSTNAIIRKFLSCGVDGYLLKNTNAIELLSAIRKVCQGDKIYCQDALAVYQNIVSKYTPDVAQKKDFTEREISIIKLITEELTNSEIADKLCISKSTVEFHKKSIYKKMKVRSSAGCVKFALSNKII